mmetsp:Transcript_12734/g.19111  ORF Transcript_12734/g.19111 Transcript_12734/m.19111 type:complete len:131 (-) Transcript_12734:921-1313(-)
MAELIPAMLDKSAAASGQGHTFCPCFSPPCFCGCGGNLLKREILPAIKCWLLARPEVLCPSSGVRTSELSLVLEERPSTAIVEEVIMWSSLHMLWVCGPNGTLIYWPFSTVATVYDDHACYLFMVLDVGA